MELDDGKVVRRVEADDLGVVHASVGGGDAEGRAGGRTVEGDDVRVGHHVAVLGEDHAGSSTSAGVARGGDRDHGGHDLRRDRVRLGDRVGVVDDDGRGPCGRPIHPVTEQVDAGDRTAEARCAADDRRGDDQPDDLPCARLLLRRRRGSEDRPKAPTLTGGGRRRAEAWAESGRRRARTTRRRADRGEERTRGARPARAGAAGRRTEAAQGCLLWPYGCCWTVGLLRRTRVRAGGSSLRRGLPACGRLGGHPDRPAAATGARRGLRPVRPEPAASRGRRSGRRGLRDVRPLCQSWGAPSRQALSL